MTSARKTLWIGLLLTAFALWPLLHYVIVQRYFVSPWRLFGWAMYCVPVYQPTVRFFALEQEERLEIPAPRQQPDAARAYARFVRHRAELGTLVGPEELGRILFAAYPQFDTLIVQVEQPVYHYDSDRIRQAFFEHRLERAE
ncbi:MAG: hypothetical protein AAF657_04235 [Acidobacteriota bacterium]